MTLTILFPWARPIQHERSITWRDRPGPARVISKERPHWHPNHANMQFMLSNSQRYLVVGLLGLVGLVGSGQGYRLLLLLGVIGLAGLALWFVWGSALTKYCCEFDNLNCMATSLTVVLVHDNVSQYFNIRTPSRYFILYHFTCLCIRPLVQQSNYSFNGCHAD